LYQVGGVAEGKAEWNVAVDDVVEGRVDVAVREHDAEESFGVGVAGEAADGRYLAQEIGGEGSGDLLRLVEEDGADRSAWSCARTR
jgi:hypothetical protein